MTPHGRVRRSLLVLAAAVAVVLALGVVAVRIGSSPSEADLLGADSPALAEFTFDTPHGCTFDADRGGMVAHFDLRTRDTGRFTVDLLAVTDEGEDDLDVPTTHAVRVTVPVYEGQTRKQFDVVVPLTQAEYEQGYRKCRYTVNPTGAE